MREAPADPAAATVSPTARSRTPTGLRVGRRADPVQMHPEITGRIEEDLEAANPALHAAIAAVTAPVEDEPTDPGAPPVPVEERPYTYLDYEERVCRLLEDIRENTRRADLRISAYEHRQHIADMDALNLQPPPVGLMATLRYYAAWLRDPSVRDLVLKVFVAGSTAGGSFVGSGTTIALVMELVERLLRAWVSLP